MRARLGGWGGGTPWTHASGDAVSLADVFSARASADRGLPAPGSRECPRPARPAPTVTRTKARVAGTAAPIRGPRPGRARGACRSVVRDPAVGVDGLAGDEAAVVADQEQARG